jgi:hypothetical protein
MADLGTGTEVIAAANFVTGALLISMGLIVIVGAILVINNMFSKYWKPVKVFTYIAAKISAEDAAIMDANRPIETKPVVPKSQPTIVK